MLEILYTRFLEILFLIIQIQMIILVVMLSLYGWYKIIKIIYNYKTNANISFVRQYENEIENKNE
tara:strand:+ start:748 stop:942 length:195 start_codon:yes stop_codon:yes gene_type:complete